ncbi:MAG TPA: ankyrin repeat domain-containing protein [Pyrinomonadaceae bacterium]|nr:ankyrin repeat domain-containing protein [Pyrinomonadaceae bacterium]
MTNTRPAYAGGTDLLFTFERLTSMDTITTNAVMPLIEAAYEGNTVQVQSLIEEGADVNERDASGRTALMIAANRGHTYVVQLLLERGADANVTDNKGTTAMQAAESRGFQRIVSMLKKFSAAPGQTENSSALKSQAQARLSLHRAVDEGDFAALKSLIEGGADVNARSSDEWTPLMLATIKGHTEMVKALLENGADTNARNRKGWTALMFAVSMSDADTTRILLSAGANINARDKEGKTALMQAAGENNRDSMRVLLGEGADINLEDHAGETVLDIARRRGYEEIVELLRKNGARSGSAKSIFPDKESAAALSSASVNDFFNEGELDRLKKELDGLLPEQWPETKSLVPQEPEDLLSIESEALVPAQLPEIGERLIAALQSLLQSRQPAEEAQLPAIAQKLMLTLHEASLLSNLSRGHLRNAIRGGKLKAKIIGRGWRIKRADLDLYIRAL